MIRPPVQVVMLIQSLQYVEEQGQNPRNLMLYGQESNPTTWIICRMNMILHNISSAIIEDGDTLEDPKILDGGTWKKFDMVIANPPFSQNYSKANMKFQNRFAYGFAPETGKKADLMFVQHMVVSLKAKGHMATIMPHGVLFRGNTEKVIRKGLVDANLLEALISLPPALFYGTGIPACVIIIINKNKDEKLRDKIFFINADAEYGEGKVQNFLRPEDIEKINYVFTHKLEIEKYSKLIDKATIQSHDYNLNIRRYVDNTPEPEPEDVKAHVTGGIPVSEIQTQQKQFAKFDFTSDVIFKKHLENYQLFRDEIVDKSAIRKTVEGNVRIQGTIEDMRKTLDTWWNTAKEDFAKLAARSETKKDKKDRNDVTYESMTEYLALGGGKMPEVRHHLITSLKEALIHKRVLDEFQVAGVFVNWWSNIKYDLKTIATVGWVSSIVPKEYFIETYFKAEQQAILQTENLINEKEASLQEALESVEYEAEEDEEITARLIKDYLNAQVKSLSEQEGAEQEAAVLKETLQGIKDIEYAIKEARSQLKVQQADLEKKIKFKMYGIDDEKEELNKLLAHNQKRLAEMETDGEPADKKQKTAYNKTLKNLKDDNARIKEHIVGLDAFLEGIGGVITAEECKTLILQKHNNLIQQELKKYLNAEKRKMIAGIEKLWDKYAVPLRQLETQRQRSLDKLNAFLKELKYSSVKTKCHISVKI